LTVAYPNQSGEVLVVPAELLLPKSCWDIPGRRVARRSISCRYAKKGGYDPHGMMDFLKTLQDIDSEKTAHAKYIKNPPLCAE